MPILPIPSVNTLVIKATDTIKTVIPHQKTSDKYTNQQAIVTRYQKHALHYALKGLGYLPEPVLERLNDSLNGPTVKQYPHADAHLRSIIALNNKFKRPLQLTTLVKLRQRFAAAAVSMQTPSVWLQPNASVKSKTKSNVLVKSSVVSWYDKSIANADGEDMSIRCYQVSANSSQQNPDKTVMLFFHGGGFCIGDVDTHHEFCHTVCAQTGWAVVSVNYRLAPEHPAPTALRDCLAAYAWLAEHCHYLNASSSRIVLAGDSAGGCLAALTAQQVTALTNIHWQGLGKDDIADASFIDMLQDLPRPLAQLPLYPVTDIKTNYPSWDLYGQGLLLDHNDVEIFNAAFLQHSSLSQAHPLISPMYADNTQMCPSYIVAAELDILRDEALAYAKQLQDYEIKVKVHKVLGAPHGFIHLMSIHQGLGRETNYIINEFASFVRQLLTVEEHTISE